MQGVFGSEKMISDEEFIDRIVLGDDTTEDKSEFLRWIKHVNASALKATCSCCPDVRAVVASNQSSDYPLIYYSHVDGYWENP